jgi:hypothetical protein
MKKLLLLLLLVSAGCTSNKIINGSLVTKNTRGTFKNVSKVEFESRKYLDQELINKASTELWDSTKLAEELIQSRKLFPGGYLVINIWALTIDAGNTKYWECVVKKKDGTEIVRETGPDEIPNVPSEGSDYWSNLFLVAVPALKEPFDVYVINNLLNVRADYTIYPDQTTKSN